MSNTTSRPKYDGVQVLRFVAAAMVVLTHSMFYANERLDSTFPVWGGGSAGVDIFFVISGFVMVVASQRDGGSWISWDQFLTRRLIRIVPMYWLVTSISVLLLLAMPAMVLHSAFEPKTIVNSYLLIPDINSDGKIEPLVGVGWTLYFESLFYVLFAISLLIRISPLVLVPPILAVLAGVSIFRSPEWPPIATYADPIVFEFALGMGIAVWSRGRQNSLLGGACLLAGVIWLVVPSVIGLSGLPRILSQGVPAALIVGGIVMLESTLTRIDLKHMVFLGEASYVLPQCVGG